jgi:uncharacterized protein (TIGR00375 family)
MGLPQLAHWAKIKGIDLLGTGDFTHPQWLGILEENLIPQGNGLYNYNEALFMFTSEISAVWRQGEKLRKVHILILAPSIEKVSKINRQLTKLGNLSADGRPTFGASVKKLVEVIWGAAPDAEIIPAHIWTPWFSVFGSRSGFDSLEECFGEHMDRIFAIETGLSSDPAMNWRCSTLDRLALVSNSDAHSPRKLGREATVFEVPEPGFAEIITAMKERDPASLIETLEFFPQEGKYHYDGHRACKVVLSPAQAIANNNLCPVCGRPLTLGVLHRVVELADRGEGVKGGGRIPYRCLVPLEEIISQALGIGTQTKGVRQEYEKMIRHFGSEFRILLDLTPQQLQRFTPDKVLQGILRVREGNLDISPGYDGVYGKIEIPFEEQKQQPSLF